MPDPPPRPPRRPGSNSDLKPVLDQTPEAGVVGQRRFDRPQQRKATLQGMGAVQFPGSPEQQTVPAPAEPSLKKTWRMPSPPSAVAASRRTPVPPADESPVPESLPVASLAPLSGDSKDAQIAALRARAEAAEHGKAELERQARVVAESQAPGPYQKPLERSASPAPEPRPKPTIEEAVTPTPAAWKAALFKVVVGFGALLTAAATVLGVRANTAIEPKVETNAVRTKVVETAADTLTERVSKLEAFARAETKRRQCVEAQLRDALARGTGHVITTLPAAPIPWSEQNAPKTEPRLLWKTPTWFTTEGCDAAPAPP